MRRIGEIVKWPGGYAMYLGRNPWGYLEIKCCEGHPTPEEAKNHGVVRIVEVAIQQADHDIRLWAEKNEEEKLA